MKNKLSTIVIVVIAIIIIGLGGYLLFKKYKSDNSNSQNTQNQSTENTSAEKSPDATKNEKEFKNDLHKLSFNYPADWNVIDVKDVQTITQPLTREDVASLYKNDENSKEIISLKLLRFVIEPNVKIANSDDWYNYIKGKVNNYITLKEITDATGYQLIAVEKTSDINGHYISREDYNLKNNIKGQDYYINNGQEMYQFVFECIGDQFNNYAETIKNIVNSFKINN